jgi:AcrR family transcriptional regulator
MARQKSDDKRKAILDAAMEVFADRGIAHAPTSAISQAAGVAEGSLFTYFKNKDELMNELYRELRKELDRELVGYPYRAHARKRLRFIWDQFLNLAKNKPNRVNVLKQLRASGRLLKESEAPNMAITEMLHTTKEAAEGANLESASAEFLVLLMRAHAEATAEYIAVHPEEEALCRELGFNFIWRGLTGR